MAQAIEQLRPQLAHGQEEPSGYGIDIKAFLKKIPKGSDVAIYIQCLDGLVIHKRSFFELIAYLVKDLSLNALIVFQLYNCSTALTLPRVAAPPSPPPPACGIELRRFHKLKEDPTGDVEKLVKGFQIEGQQAKQKSGHTKPNTSKDSQKQDTAPSRS
ncbi:hypothetical protein CC86DRAFT_405185 [Ophiobolus disseminans]|uniref:Uncharacterized protein n=1 Tax=Ophiobolus disseminans TaxID=1469910 RepID=A0A6A7A4W4_9PLEO|nr:hypothetical protein CC86DRAFT_405185 [Ophiobolus disseminans]